MQDAVVEFGENRVFVYGRVEPERPAERCVLPFDAVKNSALSLRIVRLFNPFNYKQTALYIKADIFILNSRQIHPNMEFVISNYHIYRRVRRVFPVRVVLYVRAETGVVERDVRYPFETHIRSPDRSQYALIGEPVRYYLLRNSWWLPKAPLCRRSQTAYLQIHSRTPALFSPSYVERQ